MKNDAKRKPLRVVLLDSHQRTVVGSGCTWETCDHGAVGFRVKGRQFTLLWADKGKTWLPAEDVK